MGKVFGKCGNCGTVIIGGAKEGEIKFCSKECRQFYLHPKFCDACVAQTGSDQMGGTFTVNLILGTRLMGSSNRCPTCYSVVKRKWLWIGVPLFPVSAKYRVLYQTPKRYFSRKLKVDNLA